MNGEGGRVNRTALQGARCAGRVLRRTLDRSCLVALCLGAAAAAVAASRVAARASTPGQAAVQAAQSQQAQRPVPAHPDELRFPPSRLAPPDPSGMRFELANGVPVIVAVDRSLPLVDVVLALPVGDLDEAPGEAGLASMTASMLRRGGAGELAPHQLDDEVDALGASIRSVGLSARSVIALDSGTGALERGLELLAAMVLEPRFDERRLARARSTLELGLSSAEDDPLQLLEREWLRLVHGDDAPRARQLTAEAVSAFTSEALRGFHRRHHGPEGAVFAVSGDVDPERIVGLLDELFGGWAAAGGSVPAGGSRDAADRAGAPRPAPASTAAALAAPAGRPPDGGRSAAGESAGLSGRAAAVENPGPRWSPVAAAKPGWWLLDRPGTQAAVAVGHQGVTFDSWDAQDRWALLLLVEILDGPGAVSRLRSRLQVGEGLTYRVITSFDLDPLPPGAVGTPAAGGAVRAASGGPTDRAARAERSPGAGTSPAAAGKGDAAVAPSGEFRVFFETAPESAAEATVVVLRELRRLQGDLVPAAELLTAKRSILARFPLLFDRAEAIAGRYAEDVLLGRPHEYWAVYRQRLEAATAADIRRAARKFLDPDGLAVLMTGDRQAVRSGAGAEALRRELGPLRLVEGRQ